MENKDIPNIEIENLPDGWDVADHVEKERIFRHTSGLEVILGYNDRLNDPWFAELFDPAEGSIETESDSDERKARGGAIRFMRMVSEIEGRVQ